MTSDTPGAWRASRAPLAAFVALLFALLTALAPSHAQRPDELAAEARQVLTAASVAGRFRLLESNRQGHTLGLVDEQGVVLGTVRALRRPNEWLTRLHSRRFTLAIANSAPDPTIIERLVRAANAVVASDGGPAGPAAVHIRPEHQDELFHVVLVVIALAVLAGVVRRGKIVTEIRLPHIIQVTAHSSIFLYWMLYYPGVRAHLPTMALHLALAFAADAMFCFARFGSWRLGLSPIPVVFSTNLFEWFDWRGAVLALLVAFGAKAYVHRGGKHIFNPSVAGLTVVGLLSILTHDVVHFASTFHPLNVAPNMAEWVLIAAFLGQVRFRISVLSIGAVVALRLTENPATLRPAIIIAMTLLAADPATTPKSDLGKIFFGMMVGFGLPTLSIVMRHLGQPDDFAKIMSVAVANFCVPWLDGAAGFITTWAARLRDGGDGPPAGRFTALFNRPLPNLVFVACWLALCSTWLREEKPRDFEPALHWTWGTPLIVRDADDVPRCASNPVFCEPFSFPQEAALWWRRLRAPARGSTATVSLR